MTRTLVKLGVAAIFGMACCGGATAAPLTAKDTAGQSYQLNDDGTYGIIARSEDGKSFALFPDGHWRSLDASATTADAATETRLTASIAAWVDDEGRDMPDGKRTAIKACVAAAVADLRPDAKAIILAVDDFERGAKNLIGSRPDLSVGLDAKLEICF